MKGRLIRWTLLIVLEPNLSAAEFIDVLVRSTLAERRPMNEPANLEKMLRHADLIVTARAGGKLLGVSRAITDFAFCTYLSDLAVDEMYQGHGIGRELLRAHPPGSRPGTPLALSWALAGA